MRTGNAILLTCVVALAALLAGAGARWLGSERAPEAIGRLHDLGTIRLPDTDGALHALDEWPARLRVINFWASWCPPCREEIPLLNAAQQRFGHQGVQVVGIALDDAEAVRAFTRAVPLAYPGLIAPETGGALAESFGNASGVLPYTVILDADGRALDFQLGEWRGAELESRLSQLLTR